MIPLPMHLIEKVYSFDSTYREVYNIVLEELMYYFMQEKELTDFLVDQEINRNIFEWSSSISIDSILYN